MILVPLILMVLKSGRILYFKLVNGHELFDVEFTLTTGAELNYTANTVTVAITSSVSLSAPQVEVLLEFVKFHPNLYLTRVSI